MIKKIAAIKSQFFKLCTITQAIYIGLYRFPVETFLTNASVGLLNSCSWSTDPLNLALHGSNWDLFQKSTLNYV